MLTIDSASSDGLKSERVVGEITLEDLQSSYPALPDDPILRGIDITLKTGKTLAPVKAFGPEKWTIMSLVDCFYDLSVVLLDSTASSSAA